MTRSKTNTVIIYSHRVVTHKEFYTEIQQIKNNIFSPRAKSPIKPRPPSVTVCSAACNSPPAPPLLPGPSSACGTATRLRWSFNAEQGVRLSDRKMAHRYGAALRVSRLFRPAWNTDHHEVQGQRQAVHGYRTFHLLPPPSLPVRL